MIEAGARPAGGSVTIAVDGPAGPVFQAKRGCVDLAHRTRAPIVPVDYRCRRGFTLGWRWDRALMPMPFDAIDVRYGPPIGMGAGPDESLAAAQRGIASHESG